MKKILIILCLYAGSVVGQTKMYPFTVQGTVNLDSGSVGFELVPNNAYYPNDLKGWETKVLNGKFLIKGEIPYSVGVRLTGTSNGIPFGSDVFVVDKGVQTMDYDVHKFKEINISNLSMHSLESYRMAFEEIGKETKLMKDKTDSLSLLYNKEIPFQERAGLDKQRKTLYLKSDSIVQQFVIKNPGSYLAFWKFVYLFNGWGYEPHYDNIYKAFSDSIKNSYAGKVLEKQMLVASKLSPGRLFPYKNVVTAENVQFDNSIFSNKKYTLIDLWYSSCAPCRAQFPKLIELYSLYNKRFSIIGISTDKEKYKDDWLAAIKEFKLPWPQYWDKNSVESEQLSINAFPTTILIDEHGKIIAKNISFGELSNLLKDL